MTFTCTMILNQGLTKPLMANLDIIEIQWNIEEQEFHFKPLMSLYLYKDV